MMNFNFMHLMLVDDMARLYFGLVQMEILWGGFPTYYQGLFVPSEYRL
ncbi:hypothetical protein Halxa_4127 [Halopiger xanaduensis SH-6]|uniref:Uncharacterized protein n=1 Tax=Halopiger xanaduensis (strain DSM 18323 / JCM 14033 / SH-6) TaxID=797210 RepID=F8D4X0_HALXS|nr:hypothetical protein Halxa_4127 [Halopiger xanaduensis SH-6]